MTTAVVISLSMLIVVITVQIVMTARWTGRVDGYMQEMNRRMTDAELEIIRLRDARAVSDGIIQRHEGMLLRDVERRQITRRVADFPIAETGE